MYLFFFKFFSHLGYYEVLSRVPCAVQFKYLLVIYFKYSSVYTSIANSQSILRISLFCVKFLFKSFACFFNQFSCSVVSNSLWPHESQHARPPCPSPTPSVHPNPRPSSRWCHPTISSFSIVPFSSCPQSFSASGSLAMSQLFSSGGQSTGVSASTSVLPMNTQDWFPLGWTGWISL